jgi:hypothetical protein
MIHVVGKHPEYGVPKQPRQDGNARKMSLRKGGRNEEVSSTMPDQRSHDVR